MPNLICIREVQITSTLRPTRMAIIMKIASVGKDVENMAGGKSEMVQLLWKIVWELLERLNVELPYNPAILCVGIQESIPGH